mmetsp:Transcript_163778/g.525239  ORF Transcript_163778/g.525239 Transcript_163778/m.525239 type:complete len:249 (+) Transcript_163778:149-895(+)
MCSARNQLLPLPPARPQGADRTCRSEARSGERAPRQRAAPACRHRPSRGLKRRRSARDCPQQAAAAAAAPKRQCRGKLSRSETAQAGPASACNRRPAARSLARAPPPAAAFGPRRRGGEGRRRPRRRRRASPRRRRRSEASCWAKAWQASLDRRPSTGTRAVVTGRHETSPPPAPARPPSRRLAGRREWARTRRWCGRRGRAPRTCTWRQWPRRPCALWARPRGRCGTPAVCTSRPERSGRSGSGCTS